MHDALRLKRRHALTWGRGVTAAQRAFNSSGGGSNPSGPTAEPKDTFYPESLSTFLRTCRVRRGLQPGPRWTL